LADLSFLAGAWSTTLIGDFAFFAGPEASAFDLVDLFTSSGDGSALPILWLLLVDIASGSGFWSLDFDYTSVTFLEGRADLADVVTGSVFDG